MKHRDAIVCPLQLSFLVTDRTRTWTRDAPTKVGPRDVADPAGSECSSELRDVSESTLEMSTAFRNPHPQHRANLQKIGYMS
jgi:hypothetical protein